MGISASGCPNHYSYCTGKPSPECSAIGEEGSSTQATEQSHSVEIPAHPVFATQTTSIECEPGQIAIALNGVSIYNGWVSGVCDLLDVDDDTAEWTSFDYCSGHAQQEGDYHYHFPPSCLLDQVPGFADGHSPQIGWSKDGFPIYGPLGEGGVAVAGLDSCGGKAEELPSVDKFKYRYYTSGAVSDLFTLPSSPKPGNSDYPFTIKCYVGCTWDDLISGDAKCSGGSGVAEGYTAEALNGHTAQYLSSADEAASLKCGNQGSPAAAGGVSAMGGRVPWYWIMVPPVVSILGCLLVCWRSQHIGSLRRHQRMDETEFADQRVDPAAEVAEAGADATL